MKRTIKLAVVAALALGATSAFATNGSIMIGVGAKSRGMGGTGIGVGHGAESGYSNPALITSIKGNNEISFGATAFMPDIKTTNGSNLNFTQLGGPDLGDETSTGTSAGDLYPVPTVSLASKISDNVYIGFGMWGTGGMGVDFRTDTVGGLMKMVTALQVMEFGAPMAYTTNNFTIGITPIAQYSSLDIDYKMSAGLQNGFALSHGQAPTATQPYGVGSGTAQDIAFGFNIGIAYEISNFTMGAVYKSEIEMDFDDVLSNSINPMLGGAATYDNSKLSTPSQYGVGLSYAMQGHTIAVDYKHINWEDAETYKDFGWEDQDVIAIGYEYATDAWAVRCGYQYAKSAVQDNTGKNLRLDTFVPNLTNTFNALGFPGSQETHITFGGTYAFNETISMDMAATYGLENKETVKNFLGQDITNEHSETGYTVQVNYKF